MIVQSFRDLIAWQRAMDLADKVYDVTASWPKTELFALTSLNQRAAVSVLANIAEGKGRTGPREFSHHLSIADGSLAEVEAYLLFAHRRNFIDQPTRDVLLKQVEDTRRPLRGLVRRLR